MLDWIANADANRDILCSFDKSGTPAYTDQQDFDPFQPDCGNGIKASDGTFVINDPATDLTSFGGPAAVASDAGTQAAFVQHLVNTWGGSLQYYILDNEYSDWHGVHRDVHPTGANYDEVYNKLIAFGEMVRSNNPNAQIVAPEEVGWYSFYFSGLDQQQYNID